MAHPIALERPPSVRALNVVLVLEAATYAVLAGLSMVAAVIALMTADRERDQGLADIAAIVTFGLGVFAAGLAAIAVLCWLAVRARRAVAFFLVALLHATPVVLGVLYLVGVRVLVGLTFAWLALTVLVVVLLTRPGTRGWLFNGPPRMPRSAR